MSNDLEVQFSNSFHKRVRIIMHVEVVSSMLVTMEQKGCGFDCNIGALIVPLSIIRKCKVHSLDPKGFMLSLPF